MSMLPRCTCEQLRAAVGLFDERCARHGASAKWWRELRERRETELRDQRRQCLARPVHGGYPTVPNDVRPCSEELPDAALWVYGGKDGRDA